MTGVIAVAWQRLRGRLGGQGGFTLIELLVAMVISVVMISAAIAFLVTTFDQQNQMASRTQASRQGEAGLDLLVRDLRDAIDTAGSTTDTFTISYPTNEVQLQFYVPSVSGIGGAYAANQAQVTWLCPSTTATVISTCTRTIGNTMGTTTATPAATTSTTQTTTVYGVKSLLVSSSPSSTTAVTVSSGSPPPFLDLTLKLADTSQEVYNGTSTTIVGGSHSILLQSGADLRNFP